MAASASGATIVAAVDNPQVELIGVRKEFGTRIVAVHDVDLAVGDGELFAILGPSGSGKTTVLRMIAGFEQPTAGVIKLGGVDVTGLPARRRDVNTVFQIIYAGPTTRITAHTRLGVTLSATVLTASSTWLPPDLHHGSPITLAWPEKAVHTLSSKEE